MRVALDRQEVADTDRSEPRHPAHIVPPQVNEHHVLGTLLLVGEQGAGERAVLLLGPAPRPRAGDRPDGHLPSLHPHQHLGGAAHQRNILECEVKQVRRRIERPQIAVQEQGIHRDHRLLAARQHGLERVARPDILEDPRHVPLERLPRVGRRGRDSRRGVGQRERCEVVPGAQAADDLVEPRLRRFVQPESAAGRGAARHLHGRHDDRPAEQIVDDDQRIGDHHHGVGEVERVRRGVGQALDGPHQVVAEVAHGAAREAGQPGNGHGGKLPHPLGEVSDRVVGLAGALPGGVPSPALDRRASVAPHLPGLGPEEGVASPALAAHQRLQEERERRPGHLHERRQRGISIQHHLAHERDHPALLRSRQEFGAPIGHRGVPAGMAAGSVAAIEDGNG